MAWTTPKTWSSEPLTSTDLNTYVRDNQAYLKDRLDGANAAQYAALVSASTTSTTLVDVDGTNLNLTITTTGGDVEVSLMAAGYASGSNYLVVRLLVDASSVYLVSKSLEVTSPGNASAILKITGLSAGSHTFKLQFHQTNNGTAHIDVYQFDVREIMGVVA